MQQQKCASQFKQKKYCTRKFLNYDYLNKLTVGYLENLRDEWGLDLKELY